ncbi:MAG: hypothetical protein AAF348_11605 [Bacteroidota bacterium]
MKSKTRTTGATVKKTIVTALLIIGAVAGAVAPFVHILYPKTAKEKIQLEEDFESGAVDLDTYKVKKAELKAKYRFAGFTNQRRFMFAIGLPVSLFFCSLFLLMSSKRIEQREFKKGMAIGGTLFQFTSIYFIVWTIWAYKTSEDFPKYMYYLSIILIATLSTVSTRLIINGFFYELLRLRKVKDSIIDFFIEIRNVHFKGVLKNSHKLDILDEFELKEEAREDIKKELRKERKKLTDDFEKRLHDKSFEIDS